MKFSKFLFFYTLLIVFSAAVSYILSYLLYPQKILVENYWLIFGFMAIVTLIVYYLSDLGLKKGGENQTFVLLAAITIRLIFTLFFLLFFTFVELKSNRKLLSLLRFNSYILFTTLIPNKCKDFLMVFAVKSEIWSLNCFAFSSSKVITGLFW